MGNRHTLFPLIFLLCVHALPADPPVLTDDPESPPKGHWEIFLGSAPELRDHVWLAETPHVEIEYGLLDDLQLKYEQSWIVQKVEHDGVHTGIGDPVPGLKWRFLDQDKNGISASIYPQFSFNVSSRSVDLGLVDRGWQTILPIELQKEFGSTTFFAELGYTWREHGSNGLLYGLVAEQKLTEKFSLLAELHGESAIRFQEAELLVNLGFSWKTSEHIALIGSVGTSVIEGNQSAPDLVGYVGVQLSF